MSLSGEYAVAPRVRLGLAWGHPQQAVEQGRALRDSVADRVRVELQDFRLVEPVELKSYGGTQGVKIAGRGEAPARGGRGLALERGVRFRASAAAPSARPAAHSNTYGRVPEPSKRGGADRRGAREGGNLQRAGGAPKLETVFGGGGKRALRARSARRASPARQSAGQRADRGEAAVRRGGGGRPSRREPEAASDRAS